MFQSPWFVDCEVEFWELRPELSDSNAASAVSCEEDPDRENRWWNKEVQDSTDRKRLVTKWNSLRDNRRK